MNTELIPFDESPKILSDPDIIFDKGLPFNQSSFWLVKCYNQRAKAALCCFYKTDVCKNKSLWEKGLISGFNKGFDDYYTVVLEGKLVYELIIFLQLFPTNEEELIEKAFTDELKISKRMRQAVGVTFGCPLNQAHLMNTLIDEVGASHFNDERGGRASLERAFEQS